MHYPERSFHPQEFIQKINISDMLLYNNEVGKVFPAEKKEQSLPSSWKFTGLVVLWGKNLLTKDSCPPSINPIQNGLFRSCLRMGEDSKIPFCCSLKSVKHILQWWNLTQLLRVFPKNYVTHTLSAADDADIDCILIHNG